MRVDRARIPGAAWLLFLVAVVVGRFMLPSIVTAGRSPDAATTPDLDAARALARRDGFQLVVDTVPLPLAIPDAEYAARHARDLAEAPVWDAFVLPEVLNRTDGGASTGRFFSATLLPLARLGRTPIPVFLAAREPEPGRHQADGPGARGVVAVLAARSGPHGRPLFLRQLDEPDSVGPIPSDLPLENDATWFASGATGHAVTMGKAAPIGIPVRGWWSRLAVVWALQFPGVLSTGRVPPGSVLVTERDVGGRLARYAPFARFGPAWPAVLDGRLVWIAWGYVASAAFPAATTVVWRGERVRYLRAGFIGVVEAASGRTHVYLARHADPVSRAWQRQLPELVLRGEDMPAGLGAQLRYPEELFKAQVQVLRARPGRARVADPYWWIGTAPGDSAVRLRLRAVDEVQLEPRVAAVIEGVLDVRGPHMRVLRYPEPYIFVGPSELDSTFAGTAPPGARVPGQLRMIPFEDGAVVTQSFYADSGTFEATVAGWHDAVGTGATVLDALRHLTTRNDSLSVTGATPYEAAQAWFRKLDQARAAGDWKAFGDAWAGLREALGLPPGTDRALPPRRN